MTDGLLAGKVILVTGAAGGIGRASCEVLAAAGARLVLTDLQAQAGDELAAKLSLAGAEAQFIAADLRSESEIAALIERIVDQHGRLDGAFNNAGIEGHMKPLADLTLDEWRKVIDIDLTATFLCMKYEIKAMISSGGGSIVNTAAAMTRIAFPGMGDYVSAKNGVIGLTRAAAVDYGKNNIRVNALLPGAIRTPAVDRLLENADFAAYFQNIHNRHALGRIGEPFEIGQACCWLLSNMASFVTGASISVDGGFQVT